MTTNTKNVAKSSKKNSGKKAVKQAKKELNSKGSKKALAAFGAFMLALVVSALSVVAIMLVGFAIEKIKAKTDKKKTVGNVVSAASSYKDAMGNDVKFELEADELVKKGLEAEAQARHNKACAAFDKAVAAAVKANGQGWKVRPIDS